MPGNASGLVALSAASSRDVWAVGTIQVSGHDQGSVQHWDGTRWQVVPSVNPASSDTRLLGVAAVARADAWVAGVTYALGSATAWPLLEHWNGTRWSRVSGIGSGYALNAIAAVSGSEVWAVGGPANGSGGAVALHWDGHAWHASALPAAGSQGGTLQGLASFGADDVWAVGQIVSSNVRPLVEHWDGHHWLVSSLPPISDQIARLTAVAGMSDNDLWAVGYRGSGMNSFGNSLVLHGTGSGWHVVAGMTGAQLGFSSVAAVSARDIWVAGGTSIAHWDGTHWADVSVPEGGATALAAIGPRDIWSLGVHFARDTGSSCYAGSMAVHSIAMPDVGTRDGGMSPLPDGPGALSLDPVRSRAYVRDGNGKVSVVDTKKNAVIATLSLGASGAMAIDEHSGRLYVPTARAGLAVLDAATGAARSPALPASASPSQAAFDATAGRLLVAEPSSVAILNAAGALVATVPISNPTNLVVDSRTGRAFVSSNVSSPYPGMNVAGPETRLVVLDTVTGAVLRTIAGLGGPTAVDEKAGRVFIGFVDSTAAVRISQLDAASGQLVRTYTAGRDGDAFLSDIVEDPGTATVFATTFFGLLALDPTTGVFRVLDRSTPSAIAVDPRHARLFATFPVDRNHYGVPVSPGEVAMYDQRTGVRQATIRIGIGPDVAAVDGISGKVFVLDTHGLEVIDPGAVAAGSVIQPAPSDVATALPGAKYFASTHHNLSGPFLAFWQRYGGLGALGNPISEPVVLDAHLSQYFERALLRIVDGTVVPAPLGRILTTGRNFAPASASAASAGTRYFAQTRHSLAGRFLTYWKTHHGDVLLGAPISEVALESNGDGTGRKYPTQWFENGRLEYHPELAGTAYAVEAGLAGVQAMHKQSWFR